MSRQRFDPELPQKLVTRFFAEPRQPGEKFWTTREIMQRFGVSRYAAHAAVQALVRRRVLERKLRVGTFIAASRTDSLAAGLSATTAHLGLVLPVWAAAAERNAWADALHAAVMQECRQRGWRFTCFEEPGLWGDGFFPTRFRAAGCNRLLILAPREESVLALAKLHEADVAMTSIGVGPSSLGRIPVIDGDDEEVMRRLVLQLRQDGCRRLLVVGFIDPLLGADRVRGCAEAFEQFAHDYPSDVFVLCPDQEYLAATVAKRLSGRSPSEAIIFQNHSAFLTAWDRVALLQKKMRAGLPVAVINEYYLRQRFPDVSLIEATLNPTLLARTALDVLDGCARSERTRKQTVLPYEIDWPTPRRGKSSPTR